MAQWITRLTTDQKIVGSTPAWLGIFVTMIFFIKQRLLLLQGSSSHKCREYFTALRVQKSVVRRFQCRPVELSRALRRGSRGRAANCPRERFRHGRGEALGKAGEISRSGTPGRKLG